MSGLKLISIFIFILIVSSCSYQTSQDETSDLEILDLQMQNFSEFENSNTLLEFLTEKEYSLYIQNWQEKTYEFNEYVQYLADKIGSSSLGDERNATKTRYKLLIDYGNANGNVFLENIPTYSSLRRHSLGYSDHKHSFSKLNVVGAHFIIRIYDISSIPRDGDAKLVFFKIANNCSDPKAYTDVTFCLIDELVDESEM